MTQKNFYLLEGERFLKDRWNEKLGSKKAPELYLENRAYNYEHLQKSEWSSKFADITYSLFQHKPQLMKESINLFFKYMKNRLIMGSFRYGTLSYKGKPKFDRMERIRKELSNNKNCKIESLVDSANMILLEYVEACNSADVTKKLIQSRLSVFTCTVSSFIKCYKKTNDCSFLFSLMYHILITFYNSPDKTIQSIDDCNIHVEIQ